MDIMEKDVSNIASRASASSSCSSVWSIVMLVSCFVGCWLLVVACCLLAV